MKKILLLSQFFFATLSFAQDGAPATPYYNGFNWTLTGTNLKNALTTLTINKHTNFLSYSEVWNALKNTDLDPTNTANVLLVYGWENGSDADVTNDRTRDKNSNSGSNGDWNREHIFAQALGQPELGQIGPGADAHMLRACDVQRNGQRGNRLFANGTGNSVALSNNSWYPGDEWKGDVARILMYMYLRYGEQCLPTYVTSGNTVASDSNMPEILLQWNAQDPVSQYEDNRNTYLGSTNTTYRQGNRNPFIDNPFLATKIWGGPVAQNRWPNTLFSEQFDLAKSIQMYPNPTNDGKVTVSSDVGLQSVEVITMNGQIVLKITKSAPTTEPITLENLPDGFYFIRLRNGEATETKKLIVN